MGSGFHGMGMDSMEWGDGFHGMGDGFHTFSMEWWMDSMDFPDEFHTFSMEWGMDSTLFKDGFHGMGDGFHAFLRWNGGWTPYFFHGMGDGFHIFFYLFQRSLLSSTDSCRNPAESGGIRAIPGIPEESNLAEGPAKLTK